MEDPPNADDQNATVPKITPFSGLIAYFDILGYKQIAQSGITKNIAEVLSILQNAKQPIKEEIKATDLKSYYNVDGIGQTVQSVLDSIETENVSDSLVSTINFTTCAKLVMVDGQAKPIDSTWFLAYVFILYCKRLNALLFKAGLPVRGAIEYGEIFKQERILAGKPLINAYSLSENLNCAGVVLTIATETWLKNLPCFFPILIWQHFNLLHMPTKKGTFELQCLANPGLFVKGTPISDIRNFVCASFSLHGKDVSSDILDKLENTIGLFRTEIDCVMKQRNGQVVSGLLPKQHKGNV